MLCEIGRRPARHYFQTAEVFDAQEASGAGLLHDVVAPDQLDERIGRMLEQLKSAAPKARKFFCSIGAKATTALLCARRSQSGTSLCR
jgi:enoyl-CoA hydratase/carnithine racemase